MAGTVVASARIAPGRSTIAFALLAAPWLMGLSRTMTDDAAWQGAVVLVGAVLWFPGPRQAIHVGVAAALLSVPVAQAVGPRARWFGLGGATASQPLFRSLDTEPTYGPLTDRRTGAPMLEVTAAGPALWRMQTLDQFDGRAWTVSSHPFPVLPQPAARAQTVSVRVLGLRNDLVVAPGRIDQVMMVRGTVSRAAGEARRVAPQLRTGDTYRVRSADVNVGGALLAGDRAPLDPGARAYTKLGPPATALELRALSLMLAFGVPGGGVQQPTPTVDPRVVALARRLAAGTRTEWDVVSRVERYLLGGGRFRYTTHVPDPGPQPLVDFLLRTHAGYCQQFAGAAALLLRLAGVPARVVSGFATGTAAAPGHYTVRDLDAHEWVEVYFEGYGWLTFNPTPAAAPASVANGLDPLRAPLPASGGPLGPALLAALAAMAAAAVGVVRRRRSRSYDGPTRLPLERIASRTGSHVAPSTTLGELATMLARVGPQTASLAAEVERARFGCGTSVTPRMPRIRLARALAKDVGALRAVLLWAPVPRP
jgi:transglutaminase-like putative cysteine protease